MAERLSQEDLVCANCVVKIRDPGCSEPVVAVEVRCETCQLVHYCSALCRTEHWHNNHKAVCRIFARQEILETKHKEGFCHTCSWHNTFNTKKSVISLYWEKFGYHLDDPKAFKRTKEEEYPWQCPYQLGECTGEYLGWVDEYLARIDELLTMTVTIYNVGKWSQTFQENYTQLRTTFLDLRAFYWYFSSLVKEDSSGLVDVHMARIVFIVIEEIHRKGCFPFAVLDDYIKQEDGRSPPLWEAFLDFVSRFFRRLRMAKYSIINLGEILYHR